ncbi:ABC transporter permease [Nocardia sp. SYP-A9097]|uniref:ABC transporter permease n=1 Tax=Nocardia sp. SYP-A9097 TaxID=2663237 RepID=UPI00129A30B8|nr:ABC transporter permease [Nocardia sp. SYP-A9097]MRH90508.1 ABC transporter permease [Nocardia sp. SYP-A9097]
MNRETAETTVDSAPSGVWRIVAAREIAVKLRDRNFLVSTILTVLVIVASLAISAFASSRPTTVDVGIVGAEAVPIVTTANTLADSANKKITFTAHEVADTSTLEQQVKDEMVTVGLLPDASGWRLIGKSAKNDDASTYLTAAVRQITLQRNAVAAGTSIEQLSRGSAVSYDLIDKAAVDPALAKVVSIVFAFLFYLSSILFGLSIAQSVVEEKQNRIVEILASAIPLRQLLIGKVVGNTVMAFGQLVLFGGAGLIGLAAIGKGDQVTQIAGAAGWFIIFFVVSFLALASLWAVAGALATRNEDLQSTSTPLSMSIMLVLFAGIFLSGTGRVIASYVPIVSIVAMPGRLADGSAAWWEPFIALIITAAATYGIVVTAEKLYRRSLMQTQGRLTIRQALRVED